VAKVAFIFTGYMVFRLTDKYPLAILEMLKCKSDKTLMKTSTPENGSIREQVPFADSFATGCENLEDRPAES
jgi:hypothetical protein